MPTGQFIFSIVFAFSLLMMLLPIPVLRLTLDRRVRKALPKDWQYDSSLDWYGGICRAALFGLCCVFPHVNNAPMYRHLYNDLNVAAFANRFEKIVAYCMGLGMCVFLLCIPVFFITEWLGIFVWKD